MNTKRKDSAVLAHEWEVSTREHIHCELTAFRRMLPDLLVTRKGLFVALSGGTIIDQDKDEFSLAERVSREFPDKFVLIQEVTDTIPDRLLEETSPGGASR